MVEHKSLRFARRVLPLFGAAALLTACPDDENQAMTSGNDSSTGGADGNMTTTLPPPTTITVTDTMPPDMTTSGGGTTTTGPNPTTTGMDTTTGPDTTSGSSGGTGSGSDTATGTGTGTGSTGGGMAFDCEDVDLGSMVPHTELGNTMGAGDDFDPSCGAGLMDEELAYEWTAPADGTYVFDTVGSTLDTVLVLMSACDGTEIDCNDDYYGVGGPSSLTLTMTAGESVLVGVEGYDSAGDFQLNIYELPADGWGDCAMGSPIFDCTPDEICIVDDVMAPTIGVCTAGCAVPGDCPAPPPGGTAAADCADIVGMDGVGECFLDCSTGDTCPTGMDCFMSFLCVWPA